MAESLPCIGSERTQKKDTGVKTEVAKLLEHPHWSFHEAYAPVDKEVFALDLKVEGTLPPDLVGGYARIGPNRVWNLPSTETQWHWFLGDGMVHAVKVQGGKASYTNHFLRTEKFLQEQEKGRPSTELIQARSITSFLFQLMGTKLGFLAATPANKSVSNTAIGFHNNRVLAFCEVDWPLEFRILQDGHLESEARYVYETEKVACNAHPKVDPVSGEMFWMNYDTAGRSDSFTFGVVGPDGSSRSSCTGKLSGGKSVMIHDCGITETHALVLECPVLTSIGFLSKEGSIWRYAPEHGARIGIFPRDVKSGNIDEKVITWFTIQTCYIFHIANSWQEDDNTVVMIAVRWDDIDMSGFNTAPKLVDKRTRLWRYTFHLDTGKVEEMDLSPPELLMLEFPAIHPARVGRKCRYVFAVGRCDKTEPDFHRVFKFDLQTGEFTSCPFNHGGKQLSSGECSFVPRAGSLVEDDGYLVSFVVDPDGLASSQWWVLDAKILQAPLAVVQLPARVPHGFHGLWLNEEQLKSQYRS